MKGLRRWLSRQSGWFLGYFLAGVYSLRLLGSQKSGLTGNKRAIPLVVSLTTTAERLDCAHFAIGSLLRQRCKPDRIILWLSDELAGKKGFALSPGMKKAKARGLSIKYRSDIGPFTKLNYAISEYPQAVIVTADDDKFYPAHWLEELYLSYKANPDCIHTHRAHRMTFDTDHKLKPYMDWDHRIPKPAGPSHLLFATGTGGVLYPPGLLPGELLNEEKYRSLSWPNDDIWCKAMALMQKVRIKKVGTGRGEFVSVPGTQRQSLWVDNQNRNDQLIRAVFNEYGLYTVLLSEMAVDDGSKQVFL